jgi:hypothetical protein
MLKTITSILAAIGVILMLVGLVLGSADTVSAGFGLAVLFGLLRGLLAVTRIV